MPSIQLNKLSNANVYVNGNCLLGRAEQVKLPVVKLKMTDHPALGMVGAIKLPGGFDALDGEIMWNSFYTEVWGTILNPYAAVQLQVRGNLETTSSQGRVAQTAYVVLLTVTFDEVPLGDFKQNDKTEFASKFNATYIKQQVGGQDIFELDVLANIHKVNGVDQLATYRANIGG